MKHEYDDGVILALAGGSVHYRSSRLRDVVASSVKGARRRAKGVGMTTEALLRVVRHHWATRPRINTKSPSLMPTWLLVPLFGFAMVITTPLAWGLSSTVPAYFEGASLAKEFDLVGLARGDRSHGYDCVGFRRDRQRLPEGVGEAPL
jgi:hypothetical protein